MNGLLRTVPMMHWRGPEVNGLEKLIGGQRVFLMEDVLRVGLRVQLRGMVVKIVRT